MKEFAPHVANLEYICINKESKFISSEFSSIPCKGTRYTW